MQNQEKMQEQLQRYYTLWKECTVAYEEWAKAQGLSSNSVLVLYSFYNGEECCTQKSISQKWCIPKQTVNTILKDFQKKGYVEMAAMQSDKRNKLLCLTDSGKKLADEVIGKLRQKETCVMEIMGLENMICLNDHLEQFTALFQKGDAESHV